MYNPRRLQLVLVYLLHFVILNGVCEIGMSIHFFSFELRPLRLYPVYLVGLYETALRIGRRGGGHLKTLTINQQSCRVDLELKMFTFQKH